MAADPATSVSSVQWMTAVIDRPAETFDAAAEFWHAVTGSQPADHLRVQRVDTGPARLRLELHVGEPIDDGVNLRSPAGLRWNVITHDGAARVAQPTVLPDGTRLGVQQVCIDIAPDAYEAECSFWSTLTGWTLRPGLRPEYHGLEVPPELPLHVLLQRLDEPHEDRQADAHLDLFTSNRHAAAEHHVRLGARVVDEHPFWTVMHDPSGEPYCLIQREP